ncbi:hypothetical protein METBIDRAFT_31030 [Metschnikowia bicuspidata var. bicuspidata NRRL YB-4993]|uniref:RNA polymerase II assembly factor Rtp1 C-terminal domain-containing protein n=1 Tax=Metschnikowia bicuspidata var. bicuspidata NRRL YB-4993 TaxID=869754 RepID=A0A1A0HDA7_9ASCO|nr:hypothetical protein METBIDRAFT_31030 [Metschnikowia bicuspidata var. bicuspidata NRRL YB-4993]OBA22064.1 hypothetical protein METBIDRAFT_31030 [Metschnikowia bicuspidata var. bicuspidata NRRL YB-4993]
MDTAPADPARTRNPFAPRTPSSVRRAAADVYPERKGLNRPDFVANTPLDRLFQDLEAALHGPLDSLSVAVLAERLFAADPAPPPPPADTHFQVVARLLDRLLDIQQMAQQAAAAAPQKGLVAISLHDMRTFGKLVNLVVLHGVYAPLGAFHIGVPLAQRRLHDFGTARYRPMPVAPVAPVAAAAAPAQRYAPHRRLLELVFDRLMRVFAADSDVRSLLVRGSGYADLVVVAAALATVPAFGAAVGARYAARFDAVAQAAPTFELYQNYAVLVATPQPAYFRDFVMARLQLLPACAPRGDGVLTLMEFVLGLRDNAAVTVDKLDHVARVLLARPRALAPAAYFRALGGQCYELLVNINRPTITACVAHFLAQLWAKNPRVVESFFLRPVWDAFDPAPGAAPEGVLVGERALNNNVNVLLSLAQHALPRGLVAAAFGPVALPLWAYFCFLRRHGRPADTAQNILLSFLTQLGEDPPAACAQLERICANLVAEHPWHFRVGANLLVEIAAGPPPAAAAGLERLMLDFVGRVDAHCAAFLALADQLDDRLVKVVFVALLSSWVRAQLAAATRLGENPFARLVHLRLLQDVGSRFKDRLAQTPLDILVLVRSVLGPGPASAAAPTADPGADSDDDDDDDPETAARDIATVVLELLLAIISETPPAQFSADCRHALADIRASLEKDYSALAAGRSVAARIALILDEQAPPDSSAEADRRVFARAIASLNDPLVPIRAHGLYLLRQLVETRSPVIAVDFVVTLHLLQLRDPDPFVYLNAIKGLDSLLGLADIQVLPELLAVYCGDAGGESSNETAKTEEQALRLPPSTNKEDLGAGVARSSQLNYKASLENDSQVKFEESPSHESLVKPENPEPLAHPQGPSSTGGPDNTPERTHSKPEASLEISTSSGISLETSSTSKPFPHPSQDAEYKDSPLSKTGPDSQPADLDERLRVGEVLLRYVQAQDEAFSGKTAHLVCEAALRLIRRPKNDADKPDDRLRMSAMSVLGTCCNTNALGIVDNIENAVDCALGVLDLETTKDQAIMRRSAIVLIHDLVSGTSRSENVPFPRNYMKKVIYVLRYVQGNDLDVLVREQATSVLEYIDELVKASLASED